MADNAATTSWPVDSNSTDSITMDSATSRSTRATVEANGWVVMVAASPATVRRVVLIGRGPRPARQHR